MPTPGPSTTLGRIAVSPYDSGRMCSTDDGEASNPSDQVDALPVDLDLPTGRHAGREETGQGDGKGTNDWVEKSDGGGTKRSPPPRSWNT